MKIFELILPIIIIIVAFFALREVFMWYYKINERVNLLKENNELLKKIIFAISGEPIENKEEQQS